VSLNIKNPEAHTLAQRVADLTGESLTTAVTEALRERLQKLERPDDRLASDLLAIGRDCAGRLGAARTLDPDEWLYDVNGLPK
jgi:antitoxin VapB